MPRVRRSPTPVNAARRHARDRGAEAIAPGLAVILAGWVTVTLSTCARKPVEREPPRAESSTLAEGVDASDPHPLFDRFRALLGSQSDDLDAEVAYQEFMQDRSTRELLEIARLAVSDLDPKVQIAGLGLLVDEGHEEESIPAVARLVESGVDLTAVFYAWLHAADAQLAHRMHQRVSLYFLKHISEYQGPARDRVMAFLKMKGFGEPEGDYSPIAVRRRIEALETQLGTRNP